MTSREMISSWLDSAMDTDQPLSSHPMEGKSSRSPHLTLTFRTWEKIQNSTGHEVTKINGHNLDIATIVAVAVYNCFPRIELGTEVRKLLAEGQAILQENLRAGNMIYGVNTGFGGNADLRTGDFVDLQRALTQHQHTAIMTKDDLKAYPDGDRNTNPHSMPTSWVKGSMLVRCNTNLRGHSAVNWKTIDTMMEFLRKNMTPIVPLRGSISASGDLMPLSYIAGVLQGNPDLWVRSGHGKEVKIFNSQEAFQEIHLQNMDERADPHEDPYLPITLGPKEGLALVNGTAPSATVASLAMWEANQLAVLSQLISCLTSEALAANVEWTHPFIAKVRPHPGQTEVSRNMRKLLEGSKLVAGLGDRIDRKQAGLVQDRYAIRSSPQWIGPQLEDLIHATEQLVRELNSTTDNPLINCDTRDVHCGANFQATSVTMAAEKTRLCLQMIGKMLFAQTTELLNPMLNNGLPPNLSPDDPSLSYCLKGVDINMAAYQSELEFLTNPVSSHVQTAEMHNQAINSLALISARYTMQSVELVSLMTASAIFVGLQGVDLRVLNQRWLDLNEDWIKDIVQESLVDLETNTISLEDVDDMYPTMWDKITDAWYASAKSDTKDRASAMAAAAVECVIGHLMTHEYNSPTPGQLPVDDIVIFQDNLQESMYASFIKHRGGFTKSPDTLALLGRGTAALYRFVREELQVPFYRDLQEDSEGLIIGRTEKTIGSYISIIYEALRDGRLVAAVMKSLELLVDDEK